MKTVWLALSCALMTPLTARSQSFLYSGIQSISDAGAGQTVSRGASAACTNPANLSLNQGVESYGDMSVVSVSYTYAHTNYDPVEIKQVAPPVNVGTAIQLGKNWSAGAIVAPRTAPGAKPLEIESVPMFAGSGYALYNLEVEQGGLDAAVGIGGRPLQSLPLSVGLSAVYGQETHSLKAFSVGGDATYPSVDSRYQGSSTQGLIGARIDFTPIGLSLGGSYKSAATRKYKGDIASALSNNTYVAFDGAAYEPAVAAVGLEGKAASFGWFTEFRRQMYGAGRDVASSGLPYSSKQRDYVDTNNYVLGGRWWANDFRVISLAVAKYGSNTGTGNPLPHGTAVTASDGIPEASGVEFGDFDNIPRQVVAGGLRTKVTANDYWMLGANWQRGIRVVPEGYKGEGWYQLNVISFAVGGSASF